MSISCIIVDDEPMAIEIMKQYVQKLPLLKLEGSFRDPNEALLFMQENVVELLILDIDMPEVSGIDFAALVNPQVKIIFTTSYPDYALKGFDFNTIDYILKPVTYERFLKGILKLKQYIDRYEPVKPAPAVVQHNSGEKIIFFKSGTSIYKIEIDSIRYFEKDGNYFKIFASDRSLLIRMNFARLTELLPAKYFVRIHRSYIVNLLHIDKIDVDCIMIQTSTLPIGLNFRPELDQAIAGFVQNW